MGWRRWLLPGPLRLPAWSRTLDHGQSLVPALPHHAGQAFEFGLREPPPLRQQPAGDEAESVAHHQAT